MEIIYFVKETFQLVLENKFPKMEQKKYTCNYRIYYQDGFMLHVLQNILPGLIILVKSTGTCNLSQKLSKGYLMSYQTAIKMTKARNQ